MTATKEKRIFLDTGYIADGVYCEFISSLIEFPVILGCGQVVTSEEFIFKTNLSNDFQCRLFIISFVNKMSFHVCMTYSLLGVIKQKYIFAHAKPSLYGDYCNIRDFYLYRAGFDFSHWLDAVHKPSILFLLGVLTPIHLVRKKVHSGLALESILTATA